MEKINITKTISGVIAHENELDLVINELIEKAVARHDISIQGTSKKLKEKYGESFVNPSTVQHSANPPRSEPFLRDDFWWVVGFSFSIPVVICVILSIFFIGNFNSPSDNLFYGIFGLLVGSLIGWRISSRVKKNHMKKISQQEACGGFTLWVTAHNLEQETLIVNLLKDYRATNIEIRINTGNQTQNLS